MAVKRFLLDTSTLDDSTTGLDGGLAFILDTSTLDSDRVLDGAEFLTVLTGAATLGAITATSLATITHPAIATAELGALVAETADVEVTVEAEATATLGGLVAAASATVINPVTATATLGGLAASATATVTFIAVATATLGSLTAVATATITPQPSPEPTGGGGRQYAAPRRRKPVEPVVEPVEPTVEPKRISGVASVGLGSLTARARTSITFSILEDEAELLLML